eukprot:Gb_09869 [translate_table: standard]
MSQIYPQDTDSSMQPIVDEQFCSSIKTTLTVWKKSLLFSGDGFTVFDSTGDLVFRVDTYGSNVNDELTLMDGGGKALLTLRRKIPSLHSRWEGFLGEKLYGQKPLFTVRRSSILSTNASVEVFMNSSYFCRNCDYQVEGSFAQRCCTIHSASRRAVAEVKRKCATTGVMLGKDVFTLLVEPGIDRAFVMGLIVVLDHICPEENDLLKLVIEELKGSQRLDNGDEIKRITYDIQGQADLVENKTQAIQ